MSFVRLEPQGARLLLMEDVRCASVHEGLTSAPSPLLPSILAFNLRRRARGNVLS